MTTEPAPSLLNSLQNLIPAQFRYVAHEFGLPESYLPQKVSQIEQAIELIRYAREQPNGEQRLAEIVAHAQTLQPGDAELETKTVIQSKSNSVSFGGNLEHGTIVTGGIHHPGKGDINITQTFGISEETYDRLAEHYHVTKFAIKSFFKILEQQEVPIEDLDSTLREIATHHKELLKQVANLNPLNPETDKLKQHAKESLKSGNIYLTEYYLNKASDRDRDTANYFEKEILRMLEVFNQRRLSAAASKAAIGEMKMAQLEYVKAAEYFEQAFGLVPKSQDKILSVYLSLAGNAYRNSGMYLKAKSLLEKSLTLRESFNGKGVTEITTGLNDLAELYQTMGEYRKALPLYERSLEITERTQGKEHAEVANTLNSLATLYHRITEYEKALPLYERALRIREKNLGREHPFVTIILSNLGLLYNSLKKYEKALPLLEQAVSIDEKNLGREHPQVVTTLNNLGLLYQSMGESEKAMPLYEQALRVYEKFLGREHPNVAIALNNLAKLFESMGEYEKALPLYERALGIKEKILGWEHLDVATTLSNLAGLYGSMSESGKAQSLYGQALEISEKVLGREHLNIATILNNSAVLYYSMGEYEKALPLYERALGILMKNWSLEDPNTHQVMINYDNARLGLLMRDCIGLSLKFQYKEHADNATQRVVIVHVLPDSLATQADLQAEDVVLTFNGDTLEHPVQIGEWLKKNPSGELALEVLRGEIRLSIKIDIPATQ